MYKLAIKSTQKLTVSLQLRTVTILEIHLQRLIHCSLQVHRVLAQVRGPVVEK